MVYEFKNNILYIYSDNMLNIVQTHNPITGQAFKNEEDAANWLLYYINASHSALPIKPTLSVINLNEASLLSKNEIIAGEPYKITFSFDDNCAQDKAKIFICNDTHNRVYDVDITNSTASKNIIIEEPGEYNIYFEAWCNCDSGRKVTLQKRDDFKITVK